MRRILLIVFTLLTISLFSQDIINGQHEKNYLVVVGTSKVDLVPDQFFVSVIIEGKDNEDNDKYLLKQESLFFSALKELGIDPSKDVKVVDLISKIETKIFTERFRISKKYMIELTDKALVTRLFIELPKIEIGNISLEKMESSKREEAKQQLEVEAMKSAKHKAELMTQAIGQSIGKAIYIEEQNGLFNGFFSANSAMDQNESGNINVGGSMKGDMPSPEMQPITIQYSVLVRFEIK